MTILTHAAKMKLPSWIGEGDQPARQADRDRPIDIMGRDKHAKRVATCWNVFNEPILVRHRSARRQQKLLLQKSKIERPGKSRQS